jgi:hypothetical protein
MSFLMGGPPPEAAGFINPPILSAQTSTERDLEKGGPPQGRRIYLEKCSLRGPTIQFLGFYSVEKAERSLP